MHTEGLPSTNSLPTLVLIAFRSQADTHTDKLTDATFHHTQVSVTINL